jgi:hypothetical protein
VAAPASPTRLPEDGHRRFGRGHPPAAASCRDSARSFQRRAGNPAAGAPASVIAPSPARQDRGRRRAGLSVLSHGSGQLTFPVPAEAVVRARPAREAPAHFLASSARSVAEPPKRARADPGRRQSERDSRTVGQARRTRSSGKPGSRSPDSGPRVMAYSAERPSAGPSDATR